MIFSGINLSTLGKMENEKHVTCDTVDGKELRQAPSGMKNDEFIQ